jgi:hypothetical protein
MYRIQLNGAKELLPDGLQPSDKATCYEGNMLNRAVRYPATLPRLGTYFRWKYGIQQ